MSNEIIFSFAFSNDANQDNFKCLFGHFVLKNEQNNDIHLYMNLHKEKRDRIKEISREVAVKNNWIKSFPYKVLIDCINYEDSPIILCTLIDEKTAKIENLSKLVKFLDEKTNDYNNKNDENYNRNMLMKLRMIPTNKRTISQKQQIEELIARINIQM